MFRTLSNRSKVAPVLALATLTLVFAMGCNNTVTGPAKMARVANPAPAPQPRVPVEPLALPDFALAGDGGPRITPILPGDVTRDGYVDASDVAAFAFLMRADVTRDEQVDAQDEAVLRAILSGQVADLAAPRGIIDASDMAAFAAAKTRADLTGDGVVDASDLACLVWMRDRADIDGDGIVSRRDRAFIAPELTP